MKTEEKLRQIAQQKLSQARYVRSRCGAVKPVAVLLLPNGKERELDLTHTNRREKQAMAFALAAACHQFDAPGVVVVSDAWMVTKKNTEVEAWARQRPENLADDPGRVECLTAGLYWRENCEHWSQTYRFVEGKAVFEPVKTSTGRFDQTNETGADSIFDPWRKENDSETSDD